jgi:hypothetical protein
MPTLHWLTREADLPRAERFAKEVPQLPSLATAVKWSLI